MTRYYKTVDNTEPKPINPAWCNKYWQHKAAAMRYAKQRREAEVWRMEGSDAWLVATIRDGKVSAV